MKKLKTALWCQALEAIRTAKLLELSHIEDDGQLDGLGLGSNPTIDQWEKFINECWEKKEYKLVALAVNLLNENLADLINLK